MAILMDIQGLSELRRDLQRAAIRPDPLQAIIQSSLIYIIPLEDGHSRQAPDGMVDINIPAIERRFSRDVATASRKIGLGEVPRNAYVTAINSAATYALREITTDTPRRTGMARASWTLRLADGTTHDSVSLGLTPPPVSEEQARATERAGRRLNSRRGRRG